MNTLSDLVDRIAEDAENPDGVPIIAMVDNDNVSFMFEDGDDDLLAMHPHTALVDALKLLGFQVELV